MLSGNGGCAVGAVVRHHINVQQVLGIVLLPDALQQLGDDGALVAGGDEHREPGPGQATPEVGGLSQGHQPHPHIPQPHRVIPSPRAPVRANVTGNNQSIPRASFV